MIFEFSANEFFHNTILEKHYHLIKEEMLIQKIESTKINWKEGKSLVNKNTKKTMKNKSKL